MTDTQFEETLRSLRRREPFLPFTIEFVDGKRLLIDQAEAIGFNGGAAGFIAADGSIHFILNQEVLQFSEATNGVPQGEGAK